MKKTTHTSIPYDQARAIYHLPEPHLSNEGGALRAASFLDALNRPSPFFDANGDPIRVDFGDPVHVDFTSRWDVTWGPSVNLNPTRWERMKARTAKAARRLSDAYAVAVGRKIAVDEDEYWGDC